MSISDTTATEAKPTPEQLEQNKIADQDKKIAVAKHATMAYAGFLMMLVCVLILSVGSMVSNMVNIGSITPNSVIITVLVAFGAILYVIFTVSSMLNHSKLLAERYSSK